MLFYKMNHLGNDFLILDFINENIINIDKKFIKFLSKSKLSVGFDQLITVNNFNKFKNTFEINIFNSNGNKAYQCINGSICVSYFLYYIKKYTLNNNFYIKIGKILNKVFIINKKLIKINIGKPKILHNNYFKYIQNNYKNNILIKYNIKILNLIYIGNFNLILYVKNNINKNYINIIIKIFNKYSFFIKNSNIIFMKILNKNNIKIFSYERDSKFTKSCGSGSCSALISGVLQKLIKNTVYVNYKYGKVIVHWNRYNNNVYFISKFFSFPYYGFINFK